MSDELLSKAEVEVLIIKDAEGKKVIGKQYLLKKGGIPSPCMYIQPPLAQRQGTFGTQGGIEAIARTQPEQCCTTRCPKANLFRRTSTQEPPKYIFQVSCHGFEMDYEVELPAEEKTEETKPESKIIPI